MERWLLISFQQKELIRLPVVNSLLWAATEGCSYKFGPVGARLCARPHGSFITIIFLLSLW